MKPKMNDERKKTKRLKVEQKIEILKRIEKGESSSKLAAEFGAVKSTITKVKNIAPKLKEYAAQTDTISTKRSTLKLSEYPTMEIHLYEWISKQRMNNLPLSESIVVEKAKQLHSKYEKGGFNASHGWFNRFRERHGICILKVTGEKLSSQAELVAPFLNEFNDKVAELKLLPNQIYNADEGPLTWKSLPDSTLVLASEKGASGRKKCKQRISIMPCSNATGDHKLKMLAIGKSQNPRALKNYNGAVEYVASKTAWMTRKLFTDWFHKSFVPQVLHEKNLSKHSYFKSNVFFFQGETISKRQQSE